MALNAKAKENLVFAVASMNESEKIELSYNKLEFITRCSFNGRFVSLVIRCIYQYISDNAM